MGEPEKVNAGAVAVEDLILKGRFDTGQHLDREGNARDEVGPAGCPASPDAAHQCVLVGGIRQGMFWRAEPVWTQVLIDVLGRLGVEHKSARQALARTAAEGLLESDRAGRRVRWSLTAQGRGLLSDGAARIYGFGAPTRPWAGRWLVLLITEPEVRRQLRHRLRTRLAWAGLGSPAPGVWLSPDPSRIYRFDKDGRSLASN